MDKLYKLIKINWNIKIKHYLIAILIGVFAVNAVITSSLDSVLYKKSSVNIFNKSLLRLSEAIQAKFETFLISSQTTLNNWAALPTYHDTQLSEVPRDKIRQTLQSILAKNPFITAAYEGDSNGSFYLIQRADNNTFAFISIDKSAGKTSQKETLINREGKELRAVHISSAHYDPRTRPWYKKAIATKTASWTNIYRFAAFSNVPDDLGISVSAPIYGKNGKLLKVIALDVSLDTTAKYLQSIVVNSDTAIFLVDGNNSIKRLILSPNVEKSHKFALPNRNKINDLNLPWAEKALQKYRGKNNKIFTYTVNGNKANGIVSPTLNNWQIVLVKDMHGVIGSLSNFAWLIILMHLIVLLGLILLTIWFIKRFTKPLETVTKAVDDIRDFKFSEEKLPSSNIIEVNKLAESVELIENSFKSFSRYIPRSLIQKLITSGTVADVSGESREITTLFTDIAGFSTVAESMQPRELMFFLSEYLEGMTNVINSKSGTLDKYIGDAVMAFWGAPYDDRNHALHACQCALLLQETIDRLNKNWKQKSLPALSIRIGLNTGHAVVGNVGSRIRLSYTAMGDSVNIASRLEELSKVYGTKILIGEDTYRAVSDQFLLKFVDLVAVRGRRKSMYIYELLSRDQTKLSSSELKRFNEKVSRTFYIYRVGDWEKALEKFEALLAEYPDDKVIKMFIDRCKFLRENRPRRWDGVWNLETKKR